jgi:3D (Asp-Asp-Asp) domain-containing protein
MTWFPGRRVPKHLSSGLFTLAGFVLVICLSGSLDAAFAADDPTGSAARSSQVDSLDIPGSFKDLPDARDSVTAKRSAGGIGSVAPTGPASAQLVIDAEKVARTGGVTYAVTYADSELVDFHATAYCLKGRTASGINTRPGMIAADPSVLPLGTVVHLRAGRYTGIYTVMDTGGRIKGRLVDVYVPTHREALEFGRRQVKIKVIGRGSAKGKRASKSLLASEL